MPVFGRKIPSKKGQSYWTDTEQYQAEPFLRRVVSLGVV